MAISIKHAKLSTELGVGEKFDDSEWDAEHDTSGIPDLAAGNVFTATQRVSAADVGWLFYDTSGTANARLFGLVASDDGIGFYAYNDAGVWQRTLGVFSHAGGFNSGFSATFGNTLTINGDFIMSDTEPVVYMTDTDGPTNKKKFVSFPRSGAWQMEAQNDAGAYLRTLFTFSHDGGFTSYGEITSYHASSDANFRAQGATAGKFYFEVTSAGANLKKHSIHAGDTGDTIFYNFNDDWSIKNYPLKLNADGSILAAGGQYVGPGAGAGYLRFMPGDSNTGWIGWYRASGLRTAYMGYMVSDHVLQMENGANFVIAPGSYTRIESAYRDPLCVRAFQTGGVDFAQMTFWKDGIVATYWGFDETEQFELGANSWGRHRFACNSSGQLYGAEYGWLHDRFLRDHRVVYWGGTSSVTAGNELNARSYTGAGSAYVHSFQLTSYHYAWFSYHQYLRHGTWYTIGSI